MNAMTAAAAKRKSEMTTYTIDAENNITALGSQQADFKGEIFASQQELGDLAAKWSDDRLVEVYNGIPGVTPVKHPNRPKVSATAAPKQARQARGKAG
jgi:hypothetical protein